jgi:hypothetical protein
MTRLPRTGTVKPPAGDLESLRLWLAEWEADQALRPEREDREPAAYPAARGSTGVAPPGDAADAAVVVGQVRLFRPFCDATAARPRYFAVIQSDENGGHVICPFSPFAVPAVPGEFATGRVALPLRVLCPWNAVALPDSKVLWSWVVDGLSDRELRVARAARECDGRALASGRLEGFLAGPPLVHPLDPRHDYLAEERAWVSVLRDLARGMGGVWRGRDLPLAAEPPGEYDGNPPEPRRDS